MKFLKIYGLQRTGTNYTEWLLRENFLNLHVFKGGNVLGWKHGTPPEFIDWSGNNWDNQPIIPEIIKDYQNSIKGLEKKIQEDFNKKAILHVICVRNPYSWLYKNVNLKDIFTWNKKNRCWLEYFAKNKFPYIFCDHQELIVDYIKQLEKICHNFNLDKKQDKYIDLKNEIGARLSIKNNLFRSDFYKNKCYLNFIDNISLDLIRKNIDGEIMDKLNFDIL